MKRRPDRGLAGLAGLSVLALLLAWGAARLFEEGERRRLGDRGSVFNAGPSGCRALFIMMRHEGLDARALTRPVTPGMEKGLLIVLDAGAELEGKEAEQIEAWLSGGGSVLVAAEADDALLGRLGATVEPATRSEVALAFAEPQLPALGLATGSDARLEGIGEPLYVRAGGVQGMEMAREGGGRAVVLADVWSATNAGIDAADNIFVWLDLARDLAGDRPVWFLETIHGHAREPAVAEYLAQAGWGAAVLQVLVVLLFGAWAAGARPAPALAPSSLVRRAAAEYASTMAHLYRAGNAARHAAQVAAADLEHALRRPAWARALARLPAEERSAVEKEAASLLERGRDLAARPRPDAGAVHAWIVRVARLKGRFPLADRD